MPSVSTMKPSCTTDEGRYGDALRTALLALIPTLDGYGRALKEYAEELPKTVPAPQDDRRRGGRFIEAGVRAASRTQALLWGR